MYYHDSPARVLRMPLKNGKFALSLRSVTIITQFAFLLYARSQVFALFTTVVDSRIAGSDPSNFILNCLSNKGRKWSNNVFFRTYFEWKKCKLVDQIRNVSHISIYILIFQWKFERVD